MKVPAFILRAEPVDDDAANAAGFRRAGPEVGTRHRIGGEPSFLSPEGYPRCPSCPEVMTFYGQLDSVGDGYALADVGVVQVFVCFDCFTAEAQIGSG